MAHVEQRYGGHCGRGLRTQPAVEVQHGGEHLGRAGSSPGWARTQTRLEDVVVSDQGKVAQRTDVAPLCARFELLGHRSTDN